MIQIHQDLDQTARDRREWVGFGSTRPKHIYKRGFAPVFFILCDIFSFFSSSLRPFSLLSSQTLTLIRNPIQNLFNHVLNDLFLCSKHGFIICKYFQTVNRRRSWNFSHGLRTDFLYVSCFKPFLNESSVDS